MNSFNIYKICYFMTLLGIILFTISLIMGSDTLGIISACVIFTSIFGAFLAFMTGRKK